MSTATASATMHKLGVRQTFIQGPLPRTPGAKIVGAAVTLAFMPQREDVFSGAAQEGAEKRGALWAVFETVESGGRAGHSGLCQPLQPAVWARC